MDFVMKNRIREHDTETPEATKHDDNDNYNQTVAGVLGSPVVST